MRPQSLPLRCKSGRRKQPRGEMNFMNEMENQENKILEEQESQAYEPVEFDVLSERVLNYDKAKYYLSNL